MWDLAEGLPVIIQDGATDYITGPGGLPVEQVGGDGSVLYYLQDQLGSTRGLTDASGSIVGTFSYDAYGNLTSSTGTASTPFQYAGQYTDSESGLQYLRGRYYDPQTEQFLSVDSLVGLTQQPYGYANQSPLNFADSSGLGCQIGPIGLPGPFGSGNCLSGAGDAGRTAFHVVLDVVAVLPYGIYYASYEARTSATSWGARHGPLRVPVWLVTSPLLTPEVIGLGLDVGIDWIKGHTVNNETICDEGVVGYLNPLHGFVPSQVSFLKGPKTYLPGVHHDGKVDW